MKGRPQTPWGILFILKNRVYTEPELLNAADLRSHLTCCEGHDKYSFSILYNGNLYGTACVLVLKTDQFSLSEISSIHIDSGGLDENVSGPCGENTFLTYSGTTYPRL